MFRSSKHVGEIIKYMRDSCACHTIKGGARMVTQATIVNDRILYLSNMRGRTIRPNRHHVVTQTRHPSRSIVMDNSIHIFLSIGS